MFGEKVYDNFPSTRQELKEAANCLAVDLPTAAVFHLMRISETGMRVLLEDRQITPKKPFDLQTWQELLNELETEIRKINDWPNTLGLAKTQAQEFYNNAKAELYGFKDAWRNHVMHNRKRYSFDEAKGVLDHVERFVRALAERISEGTYTPLVWTEKEIK